MFILATELELSGYVRNLGNVVEIIIQGSDDKIADFIYKLQNDLPPIAKINNLETEDITSDETASGEIEEYDVLYKEAEMIAKEEGFEAIANTFHNVRNAEEHHAKRFKALLNELKEGTIFGKDIVVSWGCRNCGYIHKGKSAPEYCENCHHPQGYFQILCEKY